MIIVIHKRVAVYAITQYVKSISKCRVVEHYDPFNVKPGISAFPYVQLCLVSKLSHFQDHCPLKRGWTSTIGALVQKNFLLIIDSPINAVCVPHIRYCHIEGTLNGHILAKLPQDSGSAVALMAAGQSSGRCCAPGVPGMAEGGSSEIAVVLLLCPR